MQSTRETRRWKVEPLYQKYGMKMNIVCESNNLHLVTQAVRCGMGYAFMPSLYMNERPELYQYAVEVNAPQEERQAYFGMTYSELALETRNARHFKNFAMNHFENIQQMVFATLTDEIPSVYKLHKKDLDLL